MNSRKRSGHAAEAGSAAVEAALIMSALLLAVVGAVETARALWTYNTMLIAVEQAGRYAMMYNHRPPAICVTQTQASQCPALSNTPLANCSAWYAQQVLAAYRTPSIGVSVAVDTTTSPRHGNDLREPLIRFHRTAPSPLRTTRSDEQRDGPDDLNSCVSAPGGHCSVGQPAVRCETVTFRPPRGQWETVKCCIPGKPKPASGEGTNNTSHIRCRSSATLNGFARSGIPEAPPERSTSACPDISITFNSR